MRLNLDARLRRSLRRGPGFSTYAVLELLLLVVLGVQAARLVWTIVTPVGPLGAWQLSEPGDASGASAILHGVDPFFRLDGGRPASGPVAVTNLQLTVFGIRLNAATGRGGAIIATADGTQNSYSVGEEIVPGVVLKAVAFDHVTLARGGHDEELYIDQSGTTATAAVLPQPAAGLAAPTDIGNGGADAGRAVTVTELRRDIGFIPRIDNGKVTGLSVRAQGVGNTFARIGLKEGDVVTQIGGRPVSGPEDIERLAASLGGGGNLSLGVERGGSVVPIVVTVRGQ